MTTVLPNTKLYFHDVLWSVPWDEIISEHNGESKRLLEVMKEMGDILEPCQNWDATPCAMAWLLLWSRNFGIAQSALALLECPLIILGGGQLRILEVLWRQAIELQLDLKVIANPDESSLGEIDPQKTGQVYNHLCAYLAYCANNESRYYGELAKNYALDAIDGQKRLEQELARGTSQDSDLYKGLLQIFWGDDIEKDGSTQVLSRQERRTYAMHERNRLRQWLEHEDLAQWDDEIRKHPVRSFPALVSDNHTSVRDTLRKYKMGFSYLSYQRASAIVHGSHIGPFMKDLGRGVMPSVLEADDDLEREAGHVRRFTYNNNFRLLQLREWIAEFCVAK